MKIVRSLFFSLCALFLFSSAGCTTYRREPFLESRSLDRFMADRPQAADLLRLHPALAEWLRTEWNRPIGDYRIFWDNDPPVHGSIGEHTAAPQYDLIAIRVSNKLGPVDQLLVLSFEVCNAQGRSNFETAQAKAASGSISREDYINEVDEREYAAVLRIKDCFQNLLPLTAGEIAATTHYKVHLEVPVEFREYQDWRIREHSESFLRTRELYGGQYDRLRKRGRVQRETR